MGLEEDSGEKLNCDGIWCCLEGEGGAVQFSSVA